MLKNQTKVAKSRQLLEYIRKNIIEGIYADGAQIPTEMALSEEFGLSRPTVARALAELQLEGLIERRAGAGTFVRFPKQTEIKTGMIGLIIPGLGETSVFDPICRNMADMAEKKNITLLWGGIIRHESFQDAQQQIEQQCQRYIDQAVQGIFFTPLEREPNRFEVNTHILGHLDNANIPVVLLDRDLDIFPKRSRYDLVGVNNYKAGYVLTQHLIGTGNKRIEFVMHRDSAATVQRRMEGYAVALMKAGLPHPPEWIHVGDPNSKDFVSSWYSRETDAIICANDDTATMLMTTLRALGVALQQDVRLGGFDDLNYVQHLQPSLTTMRQPCQGIAQVALDTMMSRIQDPTLPPRTIELDCELMIRESSRLTASQA